jgi:hypothetical protein
MKASILDVRVFSVYLCALCVSVVSAVEQWGTTETQRTPRWHREENSR